MSDAVNHSDDDDRNTRAVTNQLPDARNPTTGEADAWRAGWEAARAQILAMTERQAAWLRRNNQIDGAEWLVAIAEDIAAEEPPK